MRLLDVRAPGGMAAQWGWASIVAQGQGERVDNITVFSYQFSYNCDEDNNRTPPGQIGHSNLVREGVRLHRIIVTQRKSR